MGKLVAGLAALGWAMVLTVNAWAEALDLGAIEGVYKNRIKLAFASGETYETEDILEIVKIAENKAYVRLVLRFDNGHRCSLWGVGRVEDARLIYRPREDYRAGCELAIVPDGSALVLSDKDGVCKDSSCGARGAYEGISFELGKRRAIRYMERLKASWQFEEALEKDKGR